MPTMSTSRSRGFPLIAPMVAFSVFSIASSALASAPPIFPSDPFIVVHASNSSFPGGATISIPLSDPNVQTYDLGDAYYVVWGTTGPATIGGIATLISLNVTAAVVQQPNGSYRYGIGMDFAVEAGSEKTDFELLSPVLGFNGLFASGTTSATLGGTDENDNGLLITPYQGNQFGYCALYNGVGIPPGGNFPSVAAALGNSSFFRDYFFNPIMAGGGLSNGEAGNMDPMNPTLDMGFVHSLQSVFAFSVSAGDQAAGTSDFSVPVPSSGLLIGLGGLVLTRRRR